MSEQSSAEIDLTKKTLKLTGNDVATVVTTLLVGAIAVVLWMHNSDAKEGRGEFILMMKELSQATRESAAAQKEQNCLLRFGQEQRQQNAEFCKQMARQ